MVEYVNGIWIMVGIMLHSLWDEWKDDERGVAGIVAAVVLVLIAVLFAALFWGRIQEFFNETWGRVTDGANSIE